MILSNEIVQIKHVKSGKYLTATGFNFQEKGFLFGSTALPNNYYIGGSDDPANHYTLWQIQKIFDETNQINYGDTIYIKNLTTKMYITYDLDKYSESSKHPRVTLTEQKNKDYPFFIQSQEDFAEKGEFVYNFNSQNYIRFLTTLIDYQLHSSDKKLINQSVKGLTEIDCYGPNDETLWQIIKLDNNQREYFDIHINDCLTQKQIEIKDSDKIVIRNLWTGYTLHSHLGKYPSTGQQEVTCFHERDVNDFWVIQLVFHMEQSTITNQIPIKLVHQQTIKYLTVDINNLAKSKNGNQVRGTQNDCQQHFVLSTLDNQQLCVGKPFFLFFQPMNKYLSQGFCRTENWERQQEVIMVNKFTSKCIWVIERKIQ